MATVALCAAGARAQDLQIKIDLPAPPYPLELPAPLGRTSKQVTESGQERPPLFDAAEEAQQRGLAAAVAGKWGTAVREFRSVQELAYCAPPVTFNLALAWQRFGDKERAIAWYRVYLAQEPSARNAEAVRAQVEALASELEMESQELLDRAERVAEALPNTAATAGGKTLRQAALEGIARAAYQAGAFERGDLLLRRAAGLPGARPGSDSAEKIRAEAELEAAALIGDVQKARRVEARSSHHVRRDFLEHKMLQVLASRADGRAFMDRLNSTTRSDALAALDNIDLRVLRDFFLMPARAYEAIEALMARALEARREFDSSAYGFAVWTMEDLLWAGRPDLARRLAARLRQYFEKHPRDRTYHYAYLHFIVLFVAGEHDAIADFYAKNLLNNSWAGDRIGLIILATWRPPDTLLWLRRTLENFVTPEATSAEMAAFYGVPIAFFAFRLASGYPASSALQELFDTTKKDGVVPAEIAQAVFRFAVATGRGDLAVLIPGVGIRRFFEALHRLARLHPDPRGDHFLDFAQWSALICGGWAPRDADQAWRVARRTWLAEFGDYNPESEQRTTRWEEIARDDPTRVPVRMANSAAAKITWGARLARLED